MGDLTLCWGRLYGHMTVFLEAERTLIISPFDAHNDLNPRPLRPVQ